MDKMAEYTVFVRVVEDGGFSAAARVLRLTPSAISKQIARLEDRLGVRLINRTTRRLGLTDEGRSFYDRCVGILADIDEAEESLIRSSDSPRGKLHINTGVAFGRNQIGPLIPAFLARYPDIEVDITMTDSLSDLVEEGVDVAIRFGFLQDSTLVARHLADSRRAICASPAYLEKHGVPQHPKDLVNHNCLAFGHLPHLNDWVFKMPDGELTFRPKGNFTANNGEAIHDMAVNGLGITRMAEFLVSSDVKSGKLVRVLQNYYRDIDVPVHAIYPTKRHLSAKVRAFVDYLVESFNPVPPWEI